MPITLDGTNGITTPTYGGADTSEYLVPVTQFKNRIINGAMGIWQRGTPITTSGGYTADRWTQVSGNSIVHTQSTDAPTGFTNSLQMAGTGSNIAQRIESVNCIGLGGATVTVSLWYKNSTGSDSLSLSLYYANSTDSFGSVTQIGSNQTLAASPSSSWTYYTATFTNISANAVNGLALYIFRGSSATATGLLTGVQLEVGTQATTFTLAGGSYGAELALCQRYCYQINSDNSGNGGGTGLVGVGTGATLGGLSRCQAPIPQMRAIPSITVSNVSTNGTDLRVWNGATVTNVTGGVTNYSSINALQFDANTGVSYTAGNALSVLWQNSINNGFIRLTAEL